LVRMRATDVSSQLEELARSAKHPAVRLQALCTLDGLKTLKQATIEQALMDEAATVRRHAVRLSEQFADDSSDIVVAVLQLVDDPDPQVILQLACSHGEFNNDSCHKALAKLVWNRHDDPYVSAGIWSS